MPRRFLFALLASVVSLEAQMVVSGSARTATAGPPLQPPASVTPLEQRCVVQGRVTNAQTGEPLRKAKIHLVKDSGTMGVMGKGMQKAIRKPPMPKETSSSKVSNPANTLWQGRDLAFCGPPTAQRHRLVLGRSLL
jgi:hypothetical protein